jgi:signal transduction histidine kinase
MLPEVTKAGILAERKYAENMPLTLLDKSQLKQAFLNIIKNSMQAMPHGGTIKVATSGQSDIIKIVFEDTGHGIAPENMSRIFDPYFTTRKEGSGLGLMMTHRIVKEHGGDIEVKSQIGKGASFVITLPVRTLTPKMLPKIN